ncbi:MAG: 4-oxalocrotonate decarboxylase, partial [Alphaproteobacteria bacterium]
MTDLATIAAIVDDAARTATAIAQLSQSGHALDLDQAYRVQALSIDRRLARGEAMIGVKMGFTSRAKQVQMGLDDVIWGRLTDAMRVEDGSE